MRGQEKAARFLDASVPLRLSVVTYMELVQGCRNREELARLKKDLAARKAEILPISEAISSRAADLVEMYALGAGLLMADALIAATAQAHGLPVASANIKHFGTITDLKLVAFRP